ncbi:MAG: hypothetical protein ACH36H_02185 [Candidatus Nanopelagicales bacterium]
MVEVDLGFPRSWLEFADPEEPGRLFRCDTTWLLSRWTCIFGRGCPGIYANAPDAGCCTLGAHFADDEDRARVKRWAAELSAELWQNYSAGQRKGIVSKDDDGARQTRRFQGACIFLNAPDFPAGGGCALHLLADERGLAPQEVKPDVCWQLPVRRDYDERTWADGTTSQVVVITEYDRRGWGPGGHDLDWYCSGATEAHVADVPVYVSEAETLRHLMGTAGYDRLVDLLEVSGDGLPHPADPQLRRAAPPRRAAGASASHAAGQVRAAGELSDP